MTLSEKGITRLRRIREIALIIIRKNLGSWKSVKSKVSFVIELVAFEEYSIIEGAILPAYLTFHRILFSATN